MQHAQSRPQGPGGATPRVGPSSPHGLKPVDPKVLGELMVIAQRIGGDFRMSVELGTPGEGSFFDPYTCQISLDPIHVAESPLFAKFVAGHEGSHRAITLRLEDVGLSTEESSYLLSHVGFHAGFNGCEDNAVNTWMMKVFPGMESSVKAVYNEMFAREKVEVQLPAIEIAKRTLGRYPRFGHYISEIIRDWHQGRFSKDLDPEVEKTLRRTIKAVRRYTEITPSADAPPSERVSAMRTRLDLYRYEVWPELKKLVELDLKNEEEHQLLKKILTLKQELKALEKQANGIRHQGGGFSAKRRIDEVKAQLKALEDQGGAAFEKLDAASEELLREALRRAAQEMRQFTEALSRAASEVAQRSNELDELRKRLAQSTNEDEQRSLVAEIERKEAELNKAQRALAELEAQLQALQQMAGSGGGGFAIDMNSLSPETQDALSELLKNIPPSLRQQLRGSAEQSLRAFDDAVTDELAGKLNEPEQRHQDRSQARADAPQRQLCEYQPPHFELDREQLRKQLRRGSGSLAESPWTSALQVVGDQIHPLYLRLRQFLIPHEDPDWEPDHTSGGRLNLDRIMQSEADPRVLTRIWERRETPCRFDYRFSFLVDISGSMRGEKAEETFKGLVVLAEVLERLRIPYEIACFGSFYSNLKDFSERLDDPTRIFTAHALLANGGGTLDAPAIQCAYERLRRNLGKDNFLVVMTDGGSGLPDALASTVTRIKSEGAVRLLALGLGPGTAFVKQHYPHAVGDIPMRVSNTARSEGELEFLDVVGILLEDMITHPEAYN